MKIKAAIKQNNAVVMFSIHESQAEAEEWAAIMQTKDIWLEGYSVEYSTFLTGEQENANTLIKGQLYDIEFGKIMCAKVLSLAGSKARSEAEIDALFDNALLLKIERMLKSGSIITAKRNMESADLSALLTTDEKTNILSEMDSYLNP